MIKLILKINKFHIITVEIIYNLSLYIYLLLLKFSILFYENNNLDDNIYMLNISLISANSSVKLSWLVYPFKMSINNKSVLLVS